MVLLSHQKYMVAKLKAIFNSQKKIFLRYFKNAMKFCDISKKKNANSDNSPDKHNVCFKNVLGMIFENSLVKRP